MQTFSKEVVISALVSGVVGYLIGFYLDGFTRIGPTMNTIEAKVDSLSNCVNGYHEDASAVIDHINYSIDDGMKCKVGYNDRLDEHVACTTPNNRYGLAEGDRIHIINKKSFGRYSQMVIIQIIEEAPKSSADLFVNKNTLRELGIQGNNLSKGIFTMSLQKMTDKR